MPYVSIDDFKLGMDTRKPRVAGIPGSLVDLKNGHITRGGHVQRSKKFVSTYELPILETTCTAHAMFAVTGGTTNAANQVTSIQVDSVELLGSAVTFNTTRAQTATDIVAEIDANTVGGLAHGYDAEVVNSTGINIIAPSGRGAGENGKVVAVAVTGDLAVAADGYYDDVKFMTDFETYTDGTNPDEMTGNHDVASTVRDVDYQAAGGAHGAYGAHFDGAGSWSSGTAEYINYDDHSDYKFSGEFTIEAWVKPDADGNDRVICGKWQQTGKAWILGRTSSNQLFFDWSNTPSKLLVSSRTLPANAWSHVVVERDSGNEVRMWINGLEDVNTKNYSGSPAASVWQFQIGISFNTFYKPWSGGIDDVRISHVARYTTGTDFDNDLPGSLEGTLDVVTAATLSTVMAGGCNEGNATIGLHAQGDVLYTFGGPAAPSGMPSGVTYQRLQHKTLSETQISKMLDTENFDGKIYAIAEFTDGAVYHYYDGARVIAWDNIATAVSSNNTVASALKTKMDLHPDFDVTVSTDTATITAAVAGTGFTISATAQNFGPVNDQTIDLVNTVANDAGGSEVLATGTITITGGDDAIPFTGEIELVSGGSGSVDTITVNSVEVMGGAESYDTSLAQTATNVAAAITANTSSPDYTAVAVGAVVHISSLPGATDDPDTFVVAGTSTTIALGNEVALTGGTHNDVAFCTVDGVQINDDHVAYSTSNSVTATALAAEIQATTSSPNYTAAAVGNVVTITAIAGTGAGPNGFVVSADKEGSVTVGTTNMAGGSASGSAVKEVWTAQVTGTFETQDVFTITLNGEDFTVTGGATGTGDTVVTFKKKLYSTVSSLMYFSAINSAVDWEQPAIGAGWINFSNQDSGSEDLEALGIYQGNLGVFSDDVTQIEFVDVDEDQNTHLHTVRNSGTRSHRSVVQFGNNDLFYLDELSGVRSLQARDSSGAPQMDDVGTPIDDHILAYMEGLTDAQVGDAIGMIGPDGRYWLAISNRIYIFSFFKSSKISAWSYYEPELGDDDDGDIEQMVRIKKDVYVRSDNVVYQYGGSNRDTYADADELELEISLPFMDLDKAAHYKTLEGMDIGALNTFAINILVDPNDETVESNEFTLSNITYPNNKVGGLALRSSHFAAKLICSSAGAAELYNMAIHYHTDESS